MKTSAAGRSAIAQREGNKLSAYKDSVGVWTIGVGHTSAAGPPMVIAGMTITAEQSDEILSRDLGKTETTVSKAVNVPLSQNQFDALVSLCFNIGGGAFSGSTLVRKLNHGDYEGAAEAFLSWNHAGGKVLPGLTTRRQAERKQFLTSDHETAPAPAQEPDKPNVVLVEGTKPDETQVVIVKTPQNPPVSHPLPSNAAGFAAFGAMIIALIGGALKYFGAF